MSSIPTTHRAVVLPRVRAPLEVHEVATVPPKAGEVLVRVLWFGSTPLNLHQADGGLIITPPHIMSGCFAGAVVQLGGDPSDLGTTTTKPLQVGDNVFGFAFAQPQQRPMQEYITVPTYMCGKVPPGVPLRAAVTVPSNFVTAVHTITADLGLPLPWPVPKADGERSSAPILVWGAASSVGQYTLQVLKLWGYKNVLAVASARHHGTLRELGAAACFDYTREGVVEQILEIEEAGGIPYIIDCIGSLEGSLTPLTEIAGKGSKVAVMLPVIATHASSTQTPEYEMDVSKVLVGHWKDGVEVRGVRTHFYVANEFLKEHLQSEIMPDLLAKGLIQPNKQRVVEGATLLERAEKALALFRNGEVSGEKVVWKVAEE